MENAQIPAPMFDWDDLSATIPEYVQKQKMVDSEMNFTILANFCKHLVMMIPIWVFGKNCMHFPMLHYFEFKSFHYLSIAVNVKARHDFLDNTIGYFDKELEAYRLTMFLAIGFPLILAIGSILQFMLYRLYNRKFHPFKEMAKLKIKSKLFTLLNFKYYCRQYSSSKDVNLLFSAKPEEQPSVILTQSTKRRNL